MCIHKTQYPSFLGLVRWHRHMQGSRLWVSFLGGGYHKCSVICRLVFPGVSDGTHQISIIVSISDFPTFAA